MNINHTEEKKRNPVSHLLILKSRERHLFIFTEKKKLRHKKEMYVIDCVKGDSCCIDPTE